MKEVSQFYDRCWSKFTQQQNEEAVLLLFNRWTLNKLPFSLIEGKTVLDMGCGSGRYSYALLHLGAKKVIGIDMKEPLLNCEGFEFHKGSVLDLPFINNYFDFVFCNGVLHHTTDWKKGIAEAYRVLKPDNWAWLYFCGSNRLWQAAEEFRVLTSQTQAKLFREHLEEYNWEPNKIFFLMDSFFTPHRVLLSKEQCENELHKAGFAPVRYLDKYIENVPPLTHLRFIAQKVC